MARIKLTMPTSICGESLLRVRVADINYGHHLGNDAMVGLLHEARVLWLHQLGYTEFNVEEKSLILSELIVNYLAEAFLGDDLKIEIATGEKTSSGFELYYRVTTIRNGVNLNIAIAKTGLVFFDYSSRKISPMPEEFCKRFWS